MNLLKSSAENFPWFKANKIILHPDKIKFI